ncbi:hypothetical protein L596_029066 [Steinernema carpocapsae]|uniref:Uncharacterized protein n=1 Tax=Steinernema carpocapsae TaxID=34508 RepID=A0A4U5LTJ1_STECR|nr:hypothetical protein L596_029066 [Steinernema carpocapsae]
MVFPVTVETVHSPRSRPQMFSQHGLSVSDQTTFSWNTWNEPSPVLHIYDRKRFIKCEHFCPNNKSDYNDRLFMLSLGFDHLEFYSTSFYHSETQFKFDIALPQNVAFNAVDTPSLMLNDDVFLLQTETDNKAQSVNCHHFNMRHSLTFA